MCVVEIVEVPVDVHDAGLSTSPLIPSPVSPVSKVHLLLKVLYVTYYSSVEGCDKVYTFYCMAIPP